MQQIYRLYVREAAYLTPGREEIVQKYLYWGGEPKSLYMSKADQVASPAARGRAARMMNTLHLRTRNPVMPYNPARGDAGRQDAAESRITVFDYKAASFTEKTFSSVEEVLHFRDEDSVSWINIDGLRKQEIRTLCEHFQVHQLTVDDILSQGQRAKTDEIGDYIFCLLPMLRYDKSQDSLETEQVSVLLMKNAVLSFQDEITWDAFDPVREKLRTDHSRLRAAGADSLLNALLDAIVDQYFVAMEGVGIKIEHVEELIVKSPNNRTMVQVNFLRREVSGLRRRISPVRELIAGIMKTESPLIQKKTMNYFKDIYDHIIQAIETSEGYRELIVNLQDLYLNQMNLRMNEIMKVLAVVTALFAPMTLITGIYGMNFDYMPELHTRYGYFVVLAVMCVLFAGMLLFFKKKRWF